MSFSKLVVNHACQLDVAYRLSLKADWYEPYLHTHFANSRDQAQRAVRTWLNRLEGSVASQSGTQAVHVIPRAAFLVGGEKHPESKVLVLMRLPAGIDLRDFEAEVKTLWLSLPWATSVQRVAASSPRTLARMAAKHAKAMLPRLCTLTVAEHYDIAARDIRWRGSHYTLGHPEDDGNPEAARLDGGV
jgi:hypothetical protein